MFRYLALPTLRDAAFGVFMFSWLVTRHILFLLLIKSAFFDAPRYIPFEWSPERGRYLSYGAYNVFLALLFTLQVSGIRCPVEDKTESHAQGLFR